MPDVVSSLAVHLDFKQRVVIWSGHRFKVNSQASDVVPAGAAVRRIGRQILAVGHMDDAVIVSVLDYLPAAVQHLARLGRCEVRLVGGVVGVCCGYQVEIVCSIGTAIAITVGNEIRSRIVGLPPRPRGSHGHHQEEEQAAQVAVCLYVLVHLVFHIYSCRSFNSWFSIVGSK